MATITTIERGRRAALPAWVWFVLLWIAGAGGAMLLGAAFKAFMNATLFAVTR